MTDNIIAISPAARIEQDHAAMPLAFVIGFFFIFRVAFIYLLFQDNPMTGTIVSLAFNFMLFFGSVFYTAGSKAPHRARLPFPSPMGWMASFFLFSALSIYWTGAQSFISATGYWTAMTTDVAIVLLLLRYRCPADCLEAMLKGAVYGAAALAAIAWCSPLTADLRLGNDQFLHPNTLGMEFGIAALIAQYLMVRDANWKWLSLLLAITLLRTLSKTAIVAFVFAECWYLMQSKAWSRKAKMQMAAGALLLLASFWGLLNTYFAIYNSAGSGNQVETLTGRTVLWTVALSMSMERPWLGHGFYSFKSLIPALGPFAPVHAHNELLQQFFEYGVAGVLLAFALYASFLRQALRAPAGELRTLSMAVLIFSLVRGLTDAVPVGLTFPLWLMGALSFCLAAPQTVEVCA